MLSNSNQGKGGEAFQKLQKDKSTPTSVLCARQYSMIGCLLEIGWSKLEFLLAILGAFFAMSIKKV